MYPLALSSVCCLVGPTLSTENPEFSQGMGDCRKNFLPIIPQEFSPHNPAGSSYTCHIYSIYISTYPSIHLSTYPSIHLSTVTDRIMEMKTGTRAASNRNG